MQLVGHKSVYTFLVFLPPLCMQGTLRDCLSLCDLLGLNPSFLHIDPY